MTKLNWAIVGTDKALNKENNEIYAVVNPHKEHAKGFIEVNSYSRADEANITYTFDSHRTESQKLKVGKSEDALQYEICDMQRYINQGHGEGELELSRDVIHILNAIQIDWEIYYC